MFSLYFTTKALCLQCFNKKREKPKLLSFLRFGISTARAHLRFFVATAVPPAFLGVRTADTGIPPFLGPADIAKRKNNNANQQKDQQNICHRLTFLVPLRIWTKTNIAIARIATSPATAGTVFSVSGAVRSVPRV